MTDAGRKPDIMKLIARAPWREAVTYRDTWPHEYVVSQKNGAAGTPRRLLRADRAGRGRHPAVSFHNTGEYPFLGEYKYWTMTECPDIDLGCRRLRPQPRAPLPGPPRLRDTARRHRQERRLTVRQTRISGASGRRKGDRLPEAIQPIAVEDPIGRDDGQTARQGLCREYSVKGISMGSGQAPGARGVGNRDR